MRIIAGKFKAKRLVSPKTTKTRPTLDRVKEALFSILEPYMHNANVLDLFSGTGNLGLESISRGAKFAWLNDKEKVLYDEFKEAALQYVDEFYTSLKNVDFEDANNVLKAVVLDHLEIFWIKNFSALEILGKIGTNKSIKMNYYYTKEEAIQINEELKDKFNEIINNANTYQTDYDKIKYVHDYLIDNGTYVKYEKGEEGEYQSFISIIRDGKTVCSGFSYAFKYIMDKLGIDCIIIADINTDEDENESHMWNIVKNEEKWYNVDITYDDEISEGDGEISYMFFMKSNKMFYLYHEMQEDVPTSN